MRQGWSRWLGERGLAIGLERFGASAPYEQIYEHLGLTVDRVVEVARGLLENEPEKAGAQ